jgi:uncharacterized protein involved in response to NO
VSVSPHKFSWLCQFLKIDFRDFVRNWHNHENLCGETDTITKTYVEKLTQSRKLMWRNWHNHENLCGETDKIMKTYVEKLTQSWKLMWRNWHNHENLWGETDTITKIYLKSFSPHKFSWLCQFLHISFRDCVSFST